MFLENSIWKYNSAIKEGSFPRSVLGTSCGSFSRSVLGTSCGSFFRGVLWHFLWLFSQRCSWYFLWFVSQRCSLHFLWFVSKRCSWHFLWFVSQGCYWDFLWFFSQWVPLALSVVSQECLFKSPYGSFPSEFLGNTSIRLVTQSCSWPCPLFVSQTCCWRALHVL